MLLKLSVFKEWRLLKTKMFKKLIRNIKIVTNPIYKHEIPFYLCFLQFLSLMSQFSTYLSFTSLVKFIPTCFILSDAIVNWFFLNFSNILLLMYRNTFTFLFESSIFLVSLPKGLSVFGYLFKISPISFINLFYCFSDLHFTYYHYNLCSFFPSANFGLGSNHPQLAQFPDVWSCSFENTVHLHLKVITDRYGLTIII